MGGVVIFNMHALYLLEIDQHLCNQKLKICLPQSILPTELLNFSKLRRKVAGAVKARVTARGLSTVVARGLHGV